MHIIKKYVAINCNKDLKRFNKSNQINKILLQLETIAVNKF